MTLNTFQAIPRKPLTIGYRTDPAGLRHNNEDSLGVDSDLGLFIVADGMGGHNAGEVASRIAVEVTARSVQEGLSAGKAAAQIVHEAIADANKVILEKSLNNPAWEEMGTTLVVALAAGTQVIIGHVGDSRAYFIRKTQIKRLTEDHTFVFEWLKEGLITEDEARSHNQRHGLTEALGITDEVEAAVSVLGWEDDSCLLLCSDGLTDVLKDKEILAIVGTAPEPQHACDALVNAARQKGGTDDITVILVCG